MTRHFYKHLITGIIAPLEDAFVDVFSGSFERVEGPNDSTPVVADAAPPVETAPVDAAPAAGSVPADANAPVDANANPANSGVNP